MTLSFKLTHKPTLPTTTFYLRVPKNQRPRDLNSTPLKSMHNEKLEAWGFSNLPGKMVVKVEERTSEIKEPTV